jgi:DNA-binding GntR family transcriptional regulator
VKIVTPDELSLAQTTANRLRELLAGGQFRPGEKLVEELVASRLGISRNTLREAFRLLSAQQLLTYVPNRGVFVAEPDEAAVIDIYRARSAIQGRAILLAVNSHPAVAEMRSRAMDGIAARDREDWRSVANHNIEFHRAMVGLCDSPRLSGCFEVILAELGLVFSLIEATRHLHESYVDLNRDITSCLEAGDNEAALGHLVKYLAMSERAILAALQRKRAHRITL